MNLLKMRILAEDDELEYVPEISPKDEGLSVDVRPQWMKSLQQSVRNWLTLLPDVSNNDCNQPRPLKIIDSNQKFNRYVVDPQRYWGFRQTFWPRRVHPWLGSTRAKKIDSFIMDNLMNC